jgi:hypothetical protein
MEANMSRQSYNAFILVAMGTFIALAFVVGFLFPKIPGYAYLAAAFVGGAAILLLAKKIASRSKEALSDERDQRNASEAAYLVYRISYALTLVGGVVILNLPGLGGTWVTVGRVLLCVSIFQALLFGLINTIKYFRN